MNKIKAIIKRPDEKYGHVTNISNTLENLQKTVGGYIEVVELSGGAVMICNEEGKIINLPPNFKCGSWPHWDVIMGTVIICGTNDEEFTDVPFGMDEWKRMLQIWNN